MSEYTQYFIVKEDSEADVKKRLNNSKTTSIVDSDKDKYWFFDIYKNQTTPNWIVVTAPPESGTIDGQYKYENKFSTMCNIFETVVLFFEEENGSDWKLDIFFKGTLLSKNIYAEKIVAFTPIEKQLMESVFETEFIEMAPFLIPGKSVYFLNAMGIPYMQMNDQDYCNIEPTDTNYYFFGIRIRLT